MTVCVRTDAPTRSFACVRRPAWLRARRKGRSVTRSRPLLAYLLSVPMVTFSATANAQPPGATSGGETPMARSRALTIEGDAALEGGRYHEAAAKYRAAYYGLPEDERGSYLGSLPVRGAVRAFDSVPEQEQSDAVLLRQLVFVNEFLDAAAANVGTAPPVGEEVLAELEKVRDDLEQRLGSRQEDGHADEECDESLQAEPTAESGPVAGQAGRRTDSASRAERGWLGIGLATGGGLMAGTGVGLLIGSAVVRRRAEQVAGSNPALLDNPDARQVFEEREASRSRRLVLAGSVSLGVGLAAAAAGATLLVIRGRNAGNRGVALLPRVDSQQPGLLLSGRF